MRKTTEEDCRAEDHAMDLQKKRKREQLRQFPRMKKMNFTAPPPLAAIDSIPEDLLIMEILMKVASSSSSDLFNVKLVSKQFLEAAKDGLIFRHVSLHDIPRLPWKMTPEYLSFLERCKSNGNPEALYRQGMREFFSHRKQVSGLEKLKSSAEKGHAEASYVYGFILYRSSTSQQQEGVEILKSCETKGLRVSECRQRFKDFIRCMWINHKILSPEEESGRRRRCDCTANKPRRPGWGWTDEEDDICESCKWDREATRFCNAIC